MKISHMVSGCLVVVVTLLCVPLNSAAAPGCDSQDEEKWEKLRDKLPTTELLFISIIIDDLTKLKDKCDPKTRFSASVVKLLIQANFRQEELRVAERELLTAEKPHPSKSPMFESAIPSRPMLRR
jgi:hypothetical protein